MRNVCRNLLCVLIALTFTGCAVEKRWNVKAYDLSGKQIYDGEILTGKGPTCTAEGKEIIFSNATVIMIEK